MRWGALIAAATLALIVTTAVGYATLRGSPSAASKGAPRLHSTLSASVLSEQPAGGPDDRAIGPVASLEDDDDADDGGDDNGSDAERDHKEVKAALSSEHGLRRSIAVRRARVIPEPALVTHRVHENLAARGPPAGMLRFARPVSATHPYDGSCFSLAHLFKVAPAALGGIGSTLETRTTVPPC